MDVFSRQFSNREKALMIILALIILGTVYYFFVQKPVKETIDNANILIDELTVENEVLNAKAEQKRQMLAEVDNILQDPNAQEIPKYDNLSQLTAFLNVALSQSTSYSISVSDVQYDEKSGIYRRPVSISCTVGSYEKAKNIINDIKTCPYCSQVNGTTFQPFGLKRYTENDKATSVEDGGISLNLSMTFYETR